MTRTKRKTEAYLAALKRQSRQRRESGLGEKVTACPPPRYEPTQAEIAEATARIRANWSEAEHHRRAGLAWPPPPFALSPIIGLADIDAVLSGGL